MNWKTRAIYRVIFLASFLVGAANPAACIASNLESEIDAKAALMAKSLRSEGVTKLGVRIEGAYEDALRLKVLSSLNYSFDNQGIEVQKSNRASKYLVAVIKTVVPTSANDRFGPSYSVAFKLANRNGEPEKSKINEEQNKFKIVQDDPAELLPDLGISEDPGDRTKKKNGKVETGVITPDAAAVINGYLDPETQKVELLPQPENPDRHKVYKSPLRNDLGKLPNQSIGEDKVVYAKKNGVFGIQVLSKGKPVHHFIYEDGLAMVEFKNERTYEVLLKNHADFDVLVNLQIDGVDSGWFAKNKKVLWFCPANKSIVIKGWLKEGDTEATEFLIVDKKDSVAAQHGLSLQVGTIQASFFRAWNNKKEMALDPLERGRRGGAGTAEGDRIPAKVIRVKKIPGKMRASVAIRYDRS